MTRLYQATATIILLFSVAMSLSTLAVYDMDWVYAAVAGGVLVVVAAIGPIFPSSMKSMDAHHKKAAGALLQVVGSLCGAEFFVMAVVTWALGKRHIAPNTAYDILGIVLLLGLIGVGIQGALAMIARFAYVHNREITVPQRHAREAH